MDKEKYTIIGKLTEVKITENTQGTGSWTKRASLTVEKDGNKNYIATFDETDINKASSLNGSLVQVSYTSNGKFKNLVKGCIDASSETIPTQHIKLDHGSSEYKPQPQPQTKLPDTSTYGEIQKKKYEEQKAENERKQRLIVRQNSWTQALSYMNICLKAYEQGILVKEELNNVMFNIDKVQDIAHSIENDILRT